MLAFAQALEARCAETAGHAERVARMAGLIASRLGLDSQACENVAFAARLHDIGKVGIRDSILWKPGALTAEERAVIATHSLIGAEMLESVQIPDVICATVRAHHERWDGSGYPDGLRHDEIPLEARVVAVADAFDAMRSLRLYRPPMSHEEAMRHLWYSGEYAPDVVEALMDLNPFDPDPQVLP